MLPSLAIVDPELTYSLPKEITASSGLDALTQLIEPFVSAKANPMTDAICREGIRHAAVSLRRAYQTGADVSARRIGYGLEKVLFHFYQVKYATLRLQIYMQLLSCANLF